MRKIIVFTFLLISFIGKSQTVWNTNAGRAQFLPSLNSGTTTFEDQPTCLFGHTSLFYYFKALDTLASVDTLFTINSLDGVSFSVKIWEFDTKAEADAHYLTTGPIFSSTSAPLIAAPDTEQVLVDNGLIEGKIYLMNIVVNSCSGSLFFYNNGRTHPSHTSTDWTTSPECLGCITGFRPQVGTYILSAWVKDTEADLGAVTYTRPSIAITSESLTTSYTAQGDIIDGWQRIEQEIQVTDDESITIDLKCADDGECYFDDIRIFPKDGSMVTYVYDPITLRLMAELDERNYAKIYEYDEQGKLIRVKKETEMGVMTIQENRENNSKE